MYLHSHVLRQAGMMPVSAMPARLQHHQRTAYKPMAAVQQAQEVPGVKMHYSVASGLSIQQYHQSMCPQAPTAAAGTHGYEEQKAETYLGETFWKSIPPSPDAGLWLDDAAAAASPPMQLVSLNHAALGVQDVDAMTKCARALTLLPAHPPLLLLMHACMRADSTRGCWACGGCRGRPSPLAARGCRAAA